MDNVFGVLTIFECTPSPQSTRCHSSIPCAACLLFILHRHLNGFKLDLSVDPNTAGQVCRRRDGNDRDLC